MIADACAVFLRWTVCPQVRRAARDLSVYGLLQAWPSRRSRQSGGGHTDDCPTIGSAALFMLFSARVGPLGELLPIGAPVGAGLASYGILGLVVETIIPSRGLLVLALVGFRQLRSGIQAM